MYSLQRSKRDQQQNDCVEDYVQNDAMQKQGYIVSHEMHTLDSHQVAKIAIFTCRLPESNANHVCEHLLRLVGPAALEAPRHSTREPQHLAIREPQTQDRGC